ncbi:recombinase family protein [Photobacterium rosenbergii]|uniref:recombinase family protein n=1 Tax=Photobacterium rosenbergii TaxID=294936 RepID=UPI001C9947C5|nr:recombinase family protein [Photobacterium rosenbergii]MBY5946240.1 recombinase family protein [Photobacterium rosenbergii]
MANVGYKRVSGFKQKDDRQLEGVALDKVFTEKASAKTVDRPIWQQCIDYVREGDTLHIHSLDRVCRSGAGDAVEIVEAMNRKGVGVVFHKEGLQFNGSMSAAQKGVLGILASVAQMERELINERREEGVAAAKAKGKKFGRPTVGASKESLQELLDSGLSMVKACKQLGIGRATGYRLLKN